MKKILFFSLLMSFSAFSAIHIESEILDREKGEEVDQYICLGEGWDKANRFVYRQINDLKKVYPDLFSDLSENKKNCFAPGKIPYSAQRPLDEIMGRIEAGAQDDFYVKVGEDGSIIPANLELREKRKSLEMASTAEEQSADEQQEEKLYDEKDLNKDGLVLKNEASKLGRKIGRAELMVGGVEAFGMATLIALPKSITKWEDDWMKKSAKNLKRAWTTSPVFDKDDWAINYIGHPYAGSIYYNSIRSQGATRLQSFLFSVVQSTIWEYSWEAIAERPSIQDLIVTPVVGSVIGELAHMATYRMTKQGFNFGEKVLVTIINPTFVINNGYKIRR